MSGDDPRENENLDNQNNENEQPEPAASVVFTEMMRRAATAVQATFDPASKDDALEPTVEENEDGTLAHQDPPLRSPDELRHDAAMEQQRLHRVQRRRERRRQNTVGVFGGILRSVLVIGISGMLMATILSLWTDPESLDPEVRSSIGLRVAAESGGQPALVASPTVRVTPNYVRRVGVISGHSGIFMNGDEPVNDPGAVCYGPNGEVLLTEQEINFAVSELVVNALRSRGYTVDLMEEFDERLEGYQATALISIHANDCSEYRNVDGSLVSAFLVSQAQDRPEGGQDSRLRECVANEYGNITNLERRFSLTRDMQDYHIFREIDVRTPGVIIEIGFMLGDQNLLVNQPDLVAQGVINGLLCFLEGEMLTVPNATAIPSDAIGTEPTATPMP